MATIARPASQGSNRLTSGNRLALPHKAPPKLAFETPAATPVASPVVSLPFAPALFPGYGSASVSAAPLPALDRPPSRGGTNGAGEQPNLRNGVGILRRSASAGAITKNKGAKNRGMSISGGPGLEIEEVRGLAMDKPKDSDALVAEGTHEALMMRLKSRAARVEAESMKNFLASYRATKRLDRDSEAKLDRQLKSTERKSEELSLESDRLRIEVADAERAVERVNNLVNTAKAEKSATDAQLAAMSAFERTMHLTQADKRDEDLQNQREEANNNFNKLHRQLQTKLIELRDFRVLLNEYRHLRLDKLEENLSRVKDGRKLRQIVREMIRLSCHRVLSRVQATLSALEPWMCEVLVNCCHLEIRMEEAQRKLIPLQKEALKPLKVQVERMVHAPKESRFARLCAWTWDNLQEHGPEDNAVTLPGSTSASANGDTSRWAQKANPWKSPSVTAATSSSNSSGGDNHRDTIKVLRNAQTLSQENTSKPKNFFDAVMSVKAANKNDGANKSVLMPPDDQGPALATIQGNLEANLPISHDFASERPEVKAAELEVIALQRLLEDTRQNAAAAICSRIRQADKGGGSGGTSMEWGKQMLTLLVSEDFAKAATKELRKSQPQAMMKD